MHRSANLSCSTLPDSNITSTLPPQWTSRRTIANPIELSWKANLVFFSQPSNRFRLQWGKIFTDFRGTRKVTIWRLLWRSPNLSPRCEVRSKTAAGAWTTKDYGAAQMRELLRSTISSICWDLWSIRISRACPGSKRKQGNINYSPHVRGYRIVKSKQVSITVTLFPILPMTSGPKWHLFAYCRLTLSVLGERVSSPNQTRTQWSKLRMLSLDMVNPNLSSEMYSSWTHAAQSLTRKSCNSKRRTRCLWHGANSWTRWIRMSLSDITLLTLISPISWIERNISNAPASHTGPG